MKNKSLKTPLMIIAAGLVLCLVACLFAGMIKAPVITEQDFNYAVTYQINGETKTIEDVYRVRFVSTGKGTDPHYRYYEGFYLADPNTGEPAHHVLANQDGLKLRVVFTFPHDYLMGDSDIAETYNGAIPDPYLAAYDSMGVEYTDEETLEKFGAELISWETPQPIENNLAFSSIVMLHDGSMLLMLLIGYLAVVACMIFVKRDKTLPLNALDKVSVLFNFLIALLVIPFMTVVVLLMQIYVSGDELIYKLDLCVPVISAFTLASSIVLRRRDYRKAGFFIQFAGPVLFVIFAILERFLPA